MRCWKKLGRGGAHHPRAVELHGCFTRTILAANWRRRPRSPRNLPKGIGSWCDRIPSEEKGTYPIDQSDGGEDDDPAEHAEWQAKLVKDGAKSEVPVEEAAGTSQDSRSGRH